LKRTERHFLNDIMMSISKIEDYTEGMNLYEFIEDERTKDAVIRNLEVIGEAAKNLDERIHQQNPEIPWRKIIGLRNIILHAYFGIDWENIWKIIKEDIPGFRSDIEKIAHEHQ